MDVTDPVCGMKIRPEDAVAKTEHQGRTYHFCSESCHEEFTESPDDYVKEQ